MIVSCYIIFISFLSLVIPKIDTLFVYILSCIFFYQNIKNILFSYRLLFFVYLFIFIIKIKLKL